MHLLDSVLSTAGYKDRFFVKRLLPIVSNTISHVSIYRR